LDWFLIIALKSNCYRKIKMNNQRTFARFCKIIVICLYLRKRKSAISQGAIVARLLTKKLLAEHWITHKEFENIDEKNKKSLNDKQ